MSFWFPDKVKKCVLEEDGQPLRIFYKFTLFKTAGNWGKLRVVTDK